MMGFGLRFLNAGYSEYKPFVRINSEPLIKKIINKLKNNFNEIYVVCNNETSKQLKSIFSDEIKIIELSSPTKGAAETILKACDFLPDDEQIACIDCDTIFSDISIKKAIDKEGSFILTFYDDDKTGLYSYVTVNENNVVTEIKEKIAISNIANAGFYVFENKKLIEISCNNLLCLDSELYISMAIKELVKNNHKFEIIDITNEFDCCGTPHQLKNYSKTNKLKNEYTICFDIDGTLIYDLYTNPKKIDKNVKYCNQAFKDGHKIILHTARGMLSTNANYDLIEQKRPYIEKVLSDNGVLYHDLILMKPYADLYIDDKAIPAHKDLEKETGFYLFEDHDPRAHNKIIVDGNRIIKLGNLEGESNYYNNIPEEIKKYFPTIYQSSKSKIEMEKIKDPTFSSLLLSKKLTKNDIDILLKTINKIHTTKTEILELDLSWGYKNKVIERFEKNDSFYNSLNLSLNDYLKDIESISQYKQGIIHGDCVFTNVFLNKDFCKFIDIRGVWNDKLTIHGDILYDYAKILQSLYGYDYILHDELIEETYLKSLREYFLSELQLIHPKIKINELVIKTKLLYISLLPLHKENINRCINFTKHLKTL